MRFLQRMLLAEEHKTAEAIAVFTKLTEDFPTLPEPHNNLAVLYTANGQYAKARSALNAAIRTHPTYATVIENLGDVHAKLASQAYDKALERNVGDASTPLKLILVRSLQGAGGAGSTTEAYVPPPAETPAMATLPQAPQPLTAPSPKAAAAGIPRADTEAAGTAEHEEILRVVSGWAEAWSSRDVPAYLAYYGVDFAPPDGLARQAWENGRRARIAGTGRIDVRVEEPHVSVNGHTATVKFRLVYRSDRLSAITYKTLVLSERGGNWQIRLEQANK